MNPFVVDTNVGKAADGHANVDLTCRLACVDKLEYVMKNGIVAIDDGGLIFQEYRTHFSFAGEPGVGDAFFKHVHNYQHLGKKVKRFAVRPSIDSERGFEELPKNTLDPSDRKFLAVAVVARAIIVNATDSDWGKERTLLDKLGVGLEELCYHLPWIGLEGKRAKTDV